MGQTILGQFRILQEIGRGGMGAVYKAEQPDMDRLVAVKILHPRLASRSDLVLRFRREARAMSRLTHPNTVRVLLSAKRTSRASSTATSSPRTSSCRRREGSRTFPRCWTSASRR